MNKTLSYDEFLALKDSSTKELYLLMGDDPSFLHNSFLHFIENKPSQAESITEQIGRLIFRLDDIKRIKYLSGYLIHLTRSVHTDVIYARRIPNYLDIIETLESDLKFILKVTEDRLNEKILHASEFYASSFNKRKKHIVFHMFIPNMTKVQVKELYNGLVKLNCIPGPAVSDINDKNRTYKKFTQLFFRERREIEDWIPGKIPWLAVSSKNNQPNKKALLDFFNQLRDVRLIQREISDLDLFNLLEKNFCHPDGQDFTSFTHSNKGRNNLVESAYHHDFCKLIQSIN